MGFGADDCVQLWKILQSFKANLVFRSQFLAQFRWKTQRRAKLLSRYVMYAYISKEIVFLDIGPQL